MVPRSISALVEEIGEHHQALDALGAVADELGTASPELVELLRILRSPLVKVPVEVGGDQLGLADQLRYFEALAHANSTAGWVGFNHAGAAGKAASMLGDEGLDAVFGDGAVPFFGAVAAPTGTFVVVDGGIELTGVYHYGSGARHADWVLLSGIERSEAPTVRLGVVAASDATIGGEWDVAALKGTGSVTIEVDQVFVPDHLLADPFAPPKRGGPVYAMDYQAYVAGENLGFTIGACQRFLDELGSLATAKRRGADGRLADRGAFQFEYGRGQLQVDAARAHGIAALDRAERRCVDTGKLTRDEVVSLMAVISHSTEMAVAAVSRLLPFAGAGALFTDRAIQRYWRDAQGSAQHHVASNVAIDRFGQSLVASKERHEP